MTKLNRMEIQNGTVIGYSIRPDSHIIEIETLKLLIHSETNGNISLQMPMETLVDVIDMINSSIKG